METTSQPPTVSSNPSQAKKEKSRGDPESRFYDTLKHQKVVVVLKGGDPTPRHGVLEWVSMYSIGVSFNGETTLVMKSALVTLRLA